MQQRLAVVWRYQVVLAVLVVTCHCAAELACRRQVFFASPLA